MMKLTYIFHSGFVLEAERCILVFDYWMDPSDTMHHHVKPSGEKHIYVFASHFHEDHFTKDIFRWRNENPSTKYTYILSKDILRHHRANKEDADAWLAKGGIWEDENIKVTATGSNDSGVSWIVEVEGKRIFHAGDLCNWYARFLENGTPDRVAYSTELGENIDPIAEEKRFLGELKDIRKITDSFDLVMFPVGGRIGNGYTLGARQFIERFKVGLFAPMHFVMSGFESAWRMEPFCQRENIPFWRISHEGDSITLMEKTIIRRSSLDDMPRLNEEPYATIHRIASSGEMKGILHFAMLFALQSYRNIRIDTHRDNKVMQYAIGKEGFKYCGIIHCWNGEERLTYQFTLPSVQQG